MEFELTIEQQALVDATDALFAKYAGPERDEEAGPLAAALVLEAAAGGRRWDAPRAVLGVAHLRGRR